MITSERTVPERKTSQEVAKAVPGIQEFCKDPYLFLKYYAFTAILFIVADLVLLPRLFSLQWPSFSWWHLSLLPVAYYVGGLVPILLHNGAHRNFRPLWLNAVIGELMGVHALYGFLGWKIMHLMHHRYPDDPKLDPHPPLDLPFWKFAFSMQKNMRQCLTRYYLDFWGHTARYRRIWRIKNIFAVLRLAATLLFWFLLLGPVGFVVFYLPSYMSNTFLCIHVNFAPHRPQGDGTYEILNLDHTLYYRLANFLFWGIYIHKFHHLKPYLLNPKNFYRVRSVPRKLS